MKQVFLSRNGIEIKEAEPIVERKILIKNLYSYVSLV